jgi:hypothetical protein
MYRRREKISYLEGERGILDQNIDPCLFICSQELTIKCLHYPLCCRSVREDIPAVQQPADCQEEDPREEANPESGLQRVLRVRPAEERGGAGQRAAGVHAPRLGQGHQERGGITGLHCIRCLILIFD